MNSLKRFGLAATLIAASACSLAQSVKYEKYTLPNGMKVILHEDHSVPVVAVNIWYHVGSKDEQPRRTGFAHLFEHLMFMGTERVPTGQFDQLMETGGGSNNASTWNDRTNYYSVGPSNQLPLLLWLDADRLEDLGRTMDQKKLDLQRDVVRNERRESENSPYGKADIKLDELLFPVGHPYHHSVIGSHEDLQAATVQDVKDFFATYYVPNNASLVVAGDFNPAEAKPLIAKWFGTLPRRDEPVHLTAPPVKLDGVTRLTMVDQVQAPRVTFAWHSPAAYKPGDAEMNLVSAVLTSGINSRLYQRLVYKEPLATDVSAYQDSRMLGSVFVINVIGAPDADLAKIEAAVNEVLADFVKGGPTTDELKRQTAQLEFGTLSSLQSIEGKADRLNEFEFFLGEPNSFERVLNSYRQATPRSVQRVAAAVLKPGEKVVLTVIPESEQPPQNPRNEKPVDSAPAAWTPQAPTEFTLSNGIKVQYWNRPELPLMSLAMFFSGGADEDAPGDAGASNLAADMLDEGAGKRSATEFEQALDLLGARFAAGEAIDFSSASLSSTAANFEPALDLFADALIRPRFDPKEWDRVKRLHIEGLQQALDDPTTVATRVALKGLFGGVHPYGTPTTGTIATAQSLTLDKVKAAYERNFQPNRATLFVAGSLSESQVKQLLAAKLGSWKSSKPAPKEPEYPMIKPGPMRVLIVDKPQAPQTVVRFIMFGPKASDPERLQYDAFGTVLGGTFTSRLNANLREDKGYSYGVRSTYSMDPQAGFLTARGAVRTDVTGASLKEFLKEFEAISKGNITEDEARKARSSMRTDMVSSASSLGGMLGLAMTQYRAGRPFSALGQDLTVLNGLTAAQVNAIAGHALQLQNGVLVLVGDKDEILKQLEGLGLPKPEIVTAE
jgi:predicted Zn-dependent peptidase